MGSTDVLIGRSIPPPAVEVCLAGPLAAYQARMRAITPAYQPGDRLELYGQVYEVVRYYREVEPRHWLRCKKAEVFIPIDYEKHLQPVLH